MNDYIEDNINKLQYDSFRQVLIGCKMKSGKNQESLHLTN